MNTQSHSHHREHGGRLDIEVGDSKQSLFYPQVKVSAWNNQANFSLRYKHLEAGNVVKEEGKLKLKSKDREAHAYPKTLDFKDEHLQHRIPIDYSEPVELSNGEFEHLKIGKQIIGRDSQEEREIRRSVAAQAKGRVLVVGLGLGVILDYLDNSTVVEISPQVVDIVKDKYPERLKNVNLIINDFYRYASTTKDKFDFIYGDIFPTLTSGETEDWWKFKKAAQRLLNKNGIVTGRIEEYAERFKNQTITEEGYELEVILNTKPDNNVFPFSVQSKNVVFSYQPFLSEEDIKNGVFRPASVEGSYAVYHSSKKDNEYGTGKVAHIYRPKAHDANGNWVWGTLDYNDGVMNVVVPQKFLDGAVYPVAVDPTFGYTALGASSQTLGAQIKGTRFAGVPGTGQKITAFLSNEALTNQLKGNLYYASSLSLVPGAETQRKTIENAIPTTSIDFNFLSSPTLTGQNYYITFWGSASKGGVSLKFDTDTYPSGITGSGSGFNALWPATLTPAYDTNKYSIYVTYTASTAVQPVVKGPLKIAPSLGALQSSQVSSQLVRTTAGVLYAALISSGDVQVWKSTNNGVAWNLQDYANVKAASQNNLAMAIDGTDTIHIAYTSSTGVCNYLRYSTTTDTYTTLESIPAPTNAGVISIAVDSNNIPHVTMNGSTNSVYSNRVAGYWKQTVAVSTNPGRAVIQIGQNNVPQVALASGGNGAFAFVGNKNDATAFTSKTLESGTTFTLAGNTSLVIDSLGNTWVAYQAASNSLVKLAKHVQTDAWGTWQPAISNGYNGFTIALAADPTNIYVFYERSSGGIAYDRYDFINNKWLGEQILQPQIIGADNRTSNFKPHNPFVKWSQYFNNGDTAANNSGQQTIEYLFDDGSTVYYDKLVTAQISTGYANITFFPAAAAFTTSTSSTSSSTSTSISTSSTSTSQSTSTSSTSSSTSQSTSTSSTSSSTSISTSSTSSSISTSTSSTSTSTSSTSSSISTSSTSSSTSQSTSTSSTSSSTSTSISTSSTSQSTSTSSTSSSISTSSTSSSTSTSQSTSTSSTSSSTSRSTSTSSTSSSISTSSTSSSISTSSTSSSISTSSTSSSTSTSLSTSSTSSSTSTSFSTSSTSSSISTSSTSSSISTSSTSSSTSRSTSTSSTSQSTSTTQSFTTSTSSTSSSISTSSTSSSTSISTSSTSQSTSTSSTSTSRSTSTSSTSTSTTQSTSTSSTSTSKSTSTSSTSRSTSSSTSVSSTSSSTSTTVSITTSTSSTSSSTSSTTTLPPDPRTKGRGAIIIRASRQNIRIEIGRIRQRRFR